MCLRIKDSTRWRVPQVRGQAVEGFRVVPVITYGPVVDGAQKAPDLSSAVMMVDSEPLSTTSRPAACDSAPASLRSQQLLVVAGTKSIDGLYRPVVVAGFLCFLELLVMGEAPWTRELSLALCSDTLCRAIFARFQDQSKGKGKPPRPNEPEGLPRSFKQSPRTRRTDA